MKALFQDLFCRSHCEHNTKSASDNKPVSFDDLKALNAKTLRDIGVNRWQLLLVA
jgi:hypothetical protein